MVVIIGGFRQSGKGSGCFVVNDGDSVELLLLLLMVW